MSADFEKAMVEVNALLGLDAREFAALEDEARDMAVATFMSPVEVACALYRAISAGEPPEHVVEILLTEATEPEYVVRRRPAPSIFAAPARPWELCRNGSPVGFYTTPEEAAAAAPEKPARGSALTFLSSN